LDYINPRVLFNTLIPDQGRGEIVIQSLAVKINQKQIAAAD